MLMSSQLIAEFPRIYTLLKFKSSIRSRCTLIKKNQRKKKMCLCKAHVNTEIKSLILIGLGSGLGLGLALRSG